jgi:hypothetical protein
MHNTVFYWDYDDRFKPSTQRKMALPLYVIEGARGGGVDGDEGAGGGRGGAHKTKQATTKHLALLASLGRLGLSEHMWFRWIWSGTGAETQTIG